MALSRQQYIEALEIERSWLADQLQDAMLRKKTAEADIERLQRGHDSIMAVIGRVTLAGVSPIPEEPNKSLHSDAPKDGRE